MTCGAVVECKPCDQVVTVPSLIGARFFSSYGGAPLLIFFGIKDALGLRDTCQLDNWLARARGQYLVAPN